MRERDSLRELRREVTSKILKIHKTLWWHELSTEFAPVISSNEVASTKDNVIFKRKTEERDIKLDRKMSHMKNLIL